jgi:hypothetical protein
MCELWWVVALMTYYMCGTVCIQQFTAIWRMQTASCPDRLAHLMIGWAWWLLCCSPQCMQTCACSETHKESCRCPVLVTAS